MIVQILLWILVALVALPVLVLCLPIHLRLRAVADSDVSALLEVRILSGALPALWSGDPTKAKVRNAPRRARTKREKRRPRPRRQASDRVRRWAITGIRAVPEILGGTLRGVHLDHLRLHCRFGLEDPAETGTLFGRLCPILYGAPIPRADLQIIPDFDGESLSGEVDLALHAVPLRLAWPTLRITGETLLGIRR